MSAIDAKVNMSLDDIIKMDKKKKAATGKKGRGGRPARGGARAGARAGARGGARGAARGGSRGRSRSRVRNNNPAGPGSNKKRVRSASASGRGRGGNYGRRGITRGAKANGIQRQGQWKKQGSGIQSGFVQKKRFDKKNPNTNLRRSRSNINLNNGNQAVQKQNKAPFVQRGRSRSRSKSRTRNNTMANKPAFLLKTRGLKRTNSMPNLQDPLSVHNRLGYQNPKQLAYRNRVKKAKLLLLQRQNKGLTMKANPLKRPRRNSMGAGTLKSDQLVRDQNRRLQYGNKLMKTNPMQRGAMQNMGMMVNNMSYMQNPNQMGYFSNQNMMMPLQRPRQRGRSPFRQNMMNRGNMRRSRSRSRSMSRPRSMTRPRSRSRSQNFGYGGDIYIANNMQDRSFSEVMYSLQGNYGITGRTLNDRFSY